MLKSDQTDYFEYYYLSVALFWHDEKLNIQIMDMLKERREG